MTTRRSFVAATLAASSLASLKSALAQEPPKQADFLFVQSSKSMTFDKPTNKLTLTGVSPMTLFFTDRPERIAGNMKTTAFIPFWSEGKDSFKSDPPNADVSILEGNTLRQVVAELQDPVLTGDNLAYTVQAAAGRDAGHGRRRVGVHRHNRQAPDAVLVCRRCPAQLPAGVLLSMIVVGASLCRE
jgi:hypothetical protein